MKRRESNAGGVHQKRKSLAEIRKNVDLDAMRTGKTRSQPVAMIGAEDQEDHLRQIVDQWDVVRKKANEDRHARKEVKVEKEDLRCSGLEAAEDGVRDKLPKPPKRAVGLHLGKFIRLMHPQSYDLYDSCVLMKVLYETSIYCIYVSCAYILTSVSWYDGYNFSFLSLFLAGMVEETAQEKTDGERGAAEMSRLEEEKMTNGDAVQEMKGVRETIEVPEMTVVQEMIEGPGMTGDLEMTEDRATIVDPETIEAQEMIEDHVISAAHLETTAVLEMIAVHAMTVVLVISAAHVMSHAEGRDRGKEVACLAEVMMDGAADGPKMTDRVDRRVTTPNATSGAALIENHATSLLRGKSGVAAGTSPVTAAEPVAKTVEVGVVAAPVAAKVEETKAANGADAAAKVAMVRQDLDRLILRRATRPRKMMAGPSPKRSRSVLFLPFYLSRELINHGSRESVTFVM